ncbi:MAG: hypothetical protein ACRDE2_00285 [Chitinophagaceae bacterium]
MKKILIVSFLCGISFAALGQVKPSQTMHGNWLVDSSLMFRPGDTTFQTTFPALRYRTLDNSLYYFNLTKWQKLGTNIYNSDGALPASTSRALTIPDGSSLNFNNNNYSSSFDSSGYNMGYKGTEGAFGFSLYNRTPGASWKDPMGFYVDLEGVPNGKLNNFFLISADTGLYYTNLAGEDLFRINPTDGLNYFDNIIDGSETFSVNEGVFDFNTNGGTYGFGFNDFHANTNPLFYIYTDRNNPADDTTFKADAHGNVYIPNYPNYTQTDSFLTTNSAGEIMLKPITLSSSGITAGTYNNLTVNAQGLATAGSNQPYLTAAQNSSITGNWIFDNGINIADGNYGLSNPVVTLVGLSNNTGNVFIGYNILLSSSDTISQAFSTQSSTAIDLNSAGQAYLKTSPPGSPGAPYGSFFKTASLIATQPWVTSQNYLTTETDPIANAKTITVNSSTQALSTNPTFTVAPTTGGTGYVQNQFSAPQSSSNFWIDGNGRLDGDLGIGGDSLDLWNKTYSLNAIGAQPPNGLNRMTSSMNFSTSSNYTTPSEGIDVFSMNGSVEFDNSNNITLTNGNNVMAGTTGIITLNASGTSNWIYSDPSSALSGLLGLAKAFNNSNYGIVSVVGAYPLYTYTQGSYTSFSGHIDTAAQVLLYSNSGLSSNNMDSRIGKPYGVLQLSNYPNSLNGGLQMPIETISASTTITTANYTVISTSGTNTFTMPAASSCKGQIFHLVCNTGSVTLSVGYNNLSGTSTTTISAGTGVTIQSSGTAFYQIQ